MELVFNELSSSIAAPDKGTARQWMTTLYATMRTATDRGASPILRTTTEFWGQQLAVGYTLGDWGSDPAVDKEMKRHVKSQAGKAPFTDRLIEIEEDQREELIECHWNGQVAIGLALAVTRMHSVISLPGQSWCLDPVSVVTRHVTATAESERETEVCNWYDPGSVIRREAWLNEQLRLELRSGVQIESRRLEILKRLEFTPGALEQIRGLRGTETVFPFVLRHLFALNTQAMNWTDGQFQADYQFSCSYESQATLQRYPESRMFLCSDGQKQQFSLHSKINQERWRIHFIPIEDASRRRVLIGYVGPHLPTVRDPT